MPYTTLGYQNGPNAHFGPRKNLTGDNTQDKDYKQQALYNGNDKYESHGGQDVGKLIDQWYIFKPNFQAIKIKQLWY